MKQHRGGSGWVLGKGSSLRGGRALGQAPQGSGHGTELLEFKKCLDMLSDTWSDFWVVLCGARGWT